MVQSGIKTKMITLLRNPLQGCQLDDSFPRVERCAFNPGLCDDTLYRGYSKWRRENLASTVHLIVIQ